MVKHTTLKEIAQIAGVTTATVSYALNDSNRVSEKTKLRIKSIANELNYTPNISAKQLRTNNSKLIFAVLNTYQSNFNGEVLQEIETCFEAYGYQILSVTGHLPEVIKTNIFDGGILLNFRISDDEVMELGSTINKPLVILSSPFEGPLISSVVMDNQMGMDLIFKALKDSKHHKFCFFTGPDNSFNSIERSLSSQKNYLQMTQKEDYIIHTYNANFSINESYEIAQKLLTNQTYDSFVCFSDDMALGVYRAAQEMNLKIGIDISVTGFNNTILSKYTYPGLTTVEIDKSLWAKETVIRYFELKKNPAQNFPPLEIPMKIIHRNSIAY